MGTISLYLDDRHSKEKASLKIAVYHSRRTAYINLGITIKSEQWDAVRQCVRNHPNAPQLNMLLMQKRSTADRAMIDLNMKGKLEKMDVMQVREYINAYGENGGNVLFRDQLDNFIKTKTGGTARLYGITRNRVAAFCDIDALRFEDMNRDWLLRFDAFMAKTAPSRNSRNIHLRNIRTVFNYAIDNELITCYPFRRFKIKAEQTEKRNLSLRQLRELFGFQPQPYQVEYLDMFKLIFFLIGINIADLTGLKEITADGRVEYRRAKTHRLYSIKVEPEAREIIERYRGVRHLLDCLDTNSSYLNYAQHMNTALQKIGPWRIEGKGKHRHKVIKPLFPDLTTYWARHSWATIAASLDIPKETIAAALGHSIGNPTTAIYIDFDQKKVDEANRRVIDWVLYGKK